MIILKETSGPMAFELRRSNDRNYMVSRHDGLPNVIGMSRLAADSAHAARQYERSRDRAIAVTQRDA